MASCVLFCEGKASSLDYLVLSKLLGVSAILLEPVGGKFGSTSFIDGYIQRGGIVTVSKAFFLRDRDFDFPIPNSPSVIIIKEKGGKNRNIYSYASYRSTLENYLIDSTLIHDFISKEFPITSDRVKAILSEAAKNISNYSAVRHALGKIRKPIKLDTTWIQEGSGHLPSYSILESLENCTSEAEKLINIYTKDYKDINIEDFRSFVNDFIELFKKPEFWTNNEYLIWFHGKDLQKSISNIFSKEKIQFSWERYYRYAIEKIDFLQFPDYLQFKSILEQLAVESIN